jgi:WD40 repeat protein
MMRCSFCLIFALLLGLPNGQAGQGESRPNKKESDGPLVDLYGDPLPPGAIARMGTVRFRSGVNTFGISPDGKKLVLYSSYFDPVLQVCDAETGQVLYAVKGNSSGPGLRPKVAEGPGHKGRGIRNFGFSPDSRLLAIARGGQIELLDSSSGKLMQTLEESVGPGTDGFFPTDGKTFAQISKDRVVRVWDVSTGKMLRKISLPWFSSSAWSPNHRFLAISSDSICYWDVATGASERTIQGSPQFVSKLAFLPDSQTVVALRRNKRLLYTCKLTTGKGRNFDLGSKIDEPSMTFSPDARFLAAKVQGHADDQDAHVWEIETGKQVTPFAAGPGINGGFHDLDDFCFSPDSKLMAVKGNGSICLYAMPLGNKVHEWPIAEEGPMAFASRRTIVVAQDGPAIRFWNVASGKELAKPVGHTGSVRGMVFSMDGRVLGSCADDGTVRC